MEKKIPVASRFCKHRVLRSEKKRRNALACVLLILPAIQKHKGGHSCGNFTMDDVCDAGVSHTGYSICPEATL